MGVEWGEGWEVTSGGEDTVGVELGGRGGIPHERHSSSSGIMSPLFDPLSEEDMSTRSNSFENKDWWFYTADYIQTTSCTLNR